MHSSNLIFPHFIQLQVKGFLSDIACAYRAQKAWGSSKASEYLQVCLSLCAFLRDCVYVQVCVCVSDVMFVCMSSWRWQVGWQVGQVGPDAAFALPAAVARTLSCSGALVLPRNRSLQVHKSALALITGIRN